MKAFPLFNCEMGGTLVVIFILISLGAINFVLYGSENVIESELYAILLLLLSTLAGGQMVKIIKLPPLSGMLLVGLVWRNWNVTSFNVTSLISTSWSSFFRLKDCQ